MMGNQRDTGGGRMVSQSIPFMNINHPTFLSARQKRRHVTRSYSGRIIDRLLRLYATADIKGLVKCLPASNSAVITGQSLMSKVRFNIMYKVKILNNILTSRFRDKNCVYI
jgi:hypothetical protein